MGADLFWTAKDEKKNLKFMLVFFSGYNLSNCLLAGKQLI
jgi:hypothetical protein